MGVELTICWHIEGCCGLKCLPQIYDFPPLDNVDNIFPPPLPSALCCSGSCLEYPGKHWSAVTGFTPKMFFLMPDKGASLV